jgi:hypothetical protein
MKTTLEISDHLGPGEGTGAEAQDDAAQLGGGRFTARAGSGRGGRGITGGHQCTSEEREYSADAYE